MYEEMEGEFSKQDYPSKGKYKLEANDFGGVFYYNRTFEYPYGDIEIKVKHVERGKNKDGKESEIDLKDLPDNDKAITITKSPEPISMKKMREIHAQEEEENKKREQEARIA